MEIKDYMTRIGKQAREAAEVMAKADTATKNRALLFIAEAIRREVPLLREANQKDLALAREKGLEAALLDRLALSDKAIETMAVGLEQIAALADPIGAVSNLRFQPSGIQVGQMRVPLGVIGIIYEARPNVTVDAAGLCIKSGNATILRGGSEAITCNQVLAGLVKEGLRKAGLPENAVQVVETVDRAAVGELITMTEYVDIIVPRGGKGLIERLMRESRIPMIKHLMVSAIFILMMKQILKKPWISVSMQNASVMGPAIRWRHCWWLRMWQTSSCQNWRNVMELKQLNCVVMTGLMAS